ncbi:MAG: phosphodiesterase [Clostridia bacterium]|nr:phosphodiesterase [Clostridia bacterium]
MKLFIASDIHGSAVFCREMLEAYDREKADRLLLLGDILYHGPRNDLPEGYAPKEVIALLNERRQDILCVRGNCDTEVDQMVLQFPIMADYALLEVEGRVLFATHGHHFNTQNPPPLKKGDILLHGHTHVPAWENRGEYWYLNPGSVSIPKENTARGYMTLKDGVFRWKTLEGKEYHVMGDREFRVQSSDEDSLHYCRYADDID